MNCSDAHLAHVCGNCGGLLSVYQQAIDQQAMPVNQSSGAMGGAHGLGFRTRMQQTCATCKTADHVRAVNLPYVFRYLANELAGMGIRVKLELSS